MKKETLYTFAVIVLVLLTNDTIFSQSTFFLERNTINSLERSKIVEVNDNSFLIAYNETDNYLNESRASLLKVSNQGGIEKVREIDGPNGANLDFICTHLTNNRFLIAGSIDSIFMGDVYSKSFIQLIDDELNPINTIYLETVANKDNHFRNIQTLNDSTIYLLEQHHIIIGEIYWLKVYKINLNTGEYSYFESEPGVFSVPMDMLLNKDTTLSVFYFGSIMDSSKSRFNWILNLDNELCKISCLPQPFDLYLYSFAEWFTDSTYILSAMSHCEYIPFHTIRALSICEMSATHDSLKSVQFYPNYPEDTILYPFFNNNLAIAENTIAIGGVYHFEIYGYPTQSSPCWVQFTLFDHELNMQKQLYYGDGHKAYYGMDIIATSDGGFAMCGSVNDQKNTTIPQPDLFVLKVNSEGLMTGNSETENPAMTEVILWPNPGKEKITVKTAMQLKEATFELYNTNGKLCLTESLTAGTTNTINTAALPAGIYPYRIINAGTVVGSGKWVKE